MSGLERAPRLRNDGRGVVLVARHLILVDGLRPLFSVPATPHERGLVGGHAQGAPAS